MNLRSLQEASLVNTYSVIFVVLAFSFQLFVLLSEYGSNPRVFPQTGVFLFFGIIGFLLVLSRHGPLFVARREQTILQTIAIAIILFAVSLTAAMLLTPIVDMTMQNVMLSVSFLPPELNLDELATNPLLYILLVNVVDEELFRAGVFYLLRGGRDSDKDEIKGKHLNLPLSLVLLATIFTIMHAPIAYTTAAAFLIAWISTIFAGIVLEYYGVAPVLIFHALWNLYAYWSV